MYGYLGVESREQNGQSLSCKTVRENSGQEKRKQRYLSATVDSLVNIVRQGLYNNFAR